MKGENNWYVRSEDGKVYGPADTKALVLWARDGRIEPASFVSQDRKSWMPAQLMSELGMSWLVEIKPGKVFGPFNREVVIRLTKNGELPTSAKVYRLHELPVDQDPPPVEKIVEVPVEKIVVKEVPVEKIVEKEVIKEVPVEKIVEKEVIKEVVVEKIVEVPPPARTELVVAEVVEPVANVPPPNPPGSLFKGIGREELAALEAAAQKELSQVKKSGLKFSLFGGRRR